jgi:hypothetical protein
VQAVRSDAPGLSSFHYEGWRALSAFSLGDALETRELDVYATRMADVVQYAGARLPSAAPNLETLVLSSVHEVLYVAIYIYIYVYVHSHDVHVYILLHAWYIVKHPASGDRCLTNSLLINFRS